MNILHIALVYLSLGSTNITTNNTEVLITDIGEDASDGLPSLTCHTDLTTCCRNSDNNMTESLGTWYYPNGRALQSSSGSMAARENFYFIRNDSKLIRLNRQDNANPLEPTGSYCCVIPTTKGEMTFCVSIGIINLWQCLIQVCAPVVYNLKYISLAMQLQLHYTLIFYLS